MANLSPRLEAWLDQAKADDRRTLIVRVGGSTSAERAKRDLLGAGAEVESAGPGAIVIVVSAGRLPSVASLPWVAAVEEPRTLQLKVPKS